MSIRSRWLGRVGYQEALTLQDELVAAVRDGREPEQLLLLEHDPVYTMGRTPDQSSLPDEAALAHPVIRTNRGGQATYHGPGQLIGYPILNLRERGHDLHRYLRAIESILIDSLASYGVNGARVADLTGVWVGPRKIASIGVGVRHWISMHGFALNVCGDLAPFSQIVPCGITGVEMTSIERETGAPLPVEEAAARVSDLFRARIDSLLLSIE